MVPGPLSSFFYMSRYNFTAVMGDLARTFGWTHVQTGVFETVMPLVHGLSVVISGYQRPHRGLDRGQEGVPVRGRFAVAGAALMLTLWNVTPRGRVGH